MIAKTLSSVYAIFVIVLGAILYVNDVLGTVGHSYVEVRRSVRRRVSVDVVLPVAT